MKIYKIIPYHFVVAILEKGFNGYKLSINVNCDHDHPSTHQIGTNYYPCFNFKNDPFLSSSLKKYVIETFLNYFEEKMKGERFVNLVSIEEVKESENEETKVVKVWDFVFAETEPIEV